MPSQSRNELKRLLLNITRYFLPILFVSYLVSLTFFAHVHVVNGVTIVHSHPFKKGTANSRADTYSFPVSSDDGRCGCYFCSFSFHPFFIVPVARSSAAYAFSCSISWSDCTSGTACDSFFSYLADDILPCLRLGIV